MAAVGLVVAVWVPSSRAGIAGAAVTAVVTGRLTALETSYPDFPSWHVYRLQFQEAEEHLAAGSSPPADE